MLLVDYMRKYDAEPAVYYLGELLGLGTEEELEDREFSDLVEEEAALLLTPEVMESRLCALNDRQMELFEQACHGPVKLGPDKGSDESDMTACRYAFMVDQDNNTDSPLPHRETLSEEKRWYLDLLLTAKRLSADWLEVPEDVAALYQSINTPEFQTRRRMAFQLSRCLDVCHVLYGSAPVAVVRRMLEQETGREVSEEALLSLYAALSPDVALIVYDSETGRFTYKRIQGGELEELIRKQEGKDFYLPTPAEIETLRDRRCLPDTPAYVTYRRFLDMYAGLDEVDADAAVSTLWNHIAEGGTHQECLQGMIDWSGADSSCMKLIMTLYRNCYDQTRLHINCGHTPLEIEAAYPRETVKLKLLELELSFDDSVKTVRIGRNDPCPCGSGKKFKKCCLC